MTIKLLVQTVAVFLGGALVLALVLFPAAGTLAYWQGWLFIIVFLTCTSAIGLYLSLKDPALLERRKQVGPAAEQRSVQKVVMSLALFGNLALLVLSALDRRFGWSEMPAWVSLLGNGLIILSFVILYIVFRANSYGGSSIVTEQEQRVITTGPYALVRHPMYASVIILLLGAVLALGSWWALLLIPLLLPALAIRILDEEKLLREELPGYTEYAQRVRWRLAPGVW